MDKIVIAAMARNRIIGKDNTLPWHIPEELQLFKKTTMGCPMVMGRKTFESFPAPLPGRRHIVLSRNKKYKPAGAEAAESLDAAFQMCDQAEKIFIIGGAEIFRQALEHATTILLTLLQREVEGDVSFPELPEDQFEEVSRVEHTSGSEPFSVVTYRRTIL
ncbi:MAG: dihydrofolate reductase [Deltaproteobacteria bacterium]|nr:dihydrofolate reductase [Deltaproteobacteria bacterium]MBW2658062.1 dihydrofolate reductase [Deltaproteobacteria bacterium]